MKRSPAYITAAWCGSDHENQKLAAQRIEAARLAVAQGEKGK